MKEEYSSEDLLPLSGIQHFHFCRRQWALIHVERQWQDNVLTVEGKQMHERVDDPFFREVREGIVIARSMPVASYRLGLIGVCDLVEFTPSPEGVNLPGRDGRFLPAPVEYKHGEPKEDDCDNIQVCAQVLCLEEMLSITIPRGFLFYGKTRRRTEVDCTPDLRRKVEEMSAEMHQYYQRGYTPKVRPTKVCRSCSLQDVCLPELQARVVSASKYIQMQLDGE